MTAALSLRRRPWLILLPATKMAGQRNVWTIAATKDNAGGGGRSCCQHFGILVDNGVRALVRQTVPPLSTSGEH